jgi:hypothetical protein
VQGVQPRPKDVKRRWAAQNIVSQVVDDGFLTVTVPEGGQSVRIKAFCTIEACTFSNAAFFITAASVQHRTSILCLCVSVVRTCTCCRLQTFSDGAVTKVALAAATDSGCTFRHLAPASQTQMAQQVISTCL